MSSYQIGDKVCFKVCEELPDLYGSVYEVIGWNWNRDCIVLFDVKDRKSGSRYVSEDTIRKASWDEVLNGERDLLSNR